MEDAIKISLLKDEYLLLQKFYEDFDARIITIKGWSASIGMAAIGAGFYENRYLWLFGAVSAVVFWLVEAFWKSFQYLYGPRIEEIERAFASDDFSIIVPLQIYSSWFETLRKRGFGIFKNVSLEIVAFPHVITAIAGIALFVLQAFGYIKFPSKG
jgi:hypothetical protein